MMFLVAFAVLSSATAGGTAAALLWYGERQLVRVAVPGLEVPGDTDGDGSVDIAEIADIRNVLIVGSDSREGLRASERRELGLGNFPGVRTDTIIIVQLDPTRDAAAMLSFPRDLLVTRCDGTEGRINGAFEIGVLNDTGGPACLVRTITDFTGIPIHHYVQVDFRGFVDFVDRLGGVRMYLDEPIVDADANVNLAAGCQTLNGREALGFVRVRKIDSDFGRIARQQRFLREVLEQMTTARVALDIPRLFRLVDAAAKAVDTDRSLTVGVMRQIAFSFRDLSSDRIDARTVPAFNRDINGAAYVVADPEPAQELFAAFAAGEAAPAELGTEGPADVAIAHVPPLIVLNGTGAPGLAAGVADVLQLHGFTIAETANSPQPTTTTFVAFPRGHKEEADLVAEALGGVATRRGDINTPFTVVAGDDIDPVALASEAPTEPPAKAPEGPPAPDYAGASPEEERRDC